jgi:hypothetical protein
VRVKTFASIFFQLTAPRGVELDQNVLVLVLGDLLEVLADQNLQKEPLRTHVATGSGASMYK